MKYTISDLRRDFPDDEACLKYILEQKHGAGRLIPGRKTFVREGKHISPLKGTIFEKSKTPLTLWFYALYLFSVSKNGISAKEIQRQLGVTYKCAWRMTTKIRTLMKQNTEPLKGIVEVDETYFGGRHTEALKFKRKMAVMGMVERGGRARMITLEARDTHIILNHIIDNVDRRAQLVSDEASAYKKLPKIGFSSFRVKHGKGHYVDGQIHTNHIEGIWGQLKRSLRGTHHSVSPKYLQTYLDQFVWNYNHRNDPQPPFLSLLQEI